MRRRGRRLARGPQFITARRTAASTRDQVRVVHADGAWQVAVDHRFVAVRQIAEDNLAAVSRLFGQAGVPFFVRDVASPGPITVGVDAAHRSRALAALAGAGTDEYLYACDARGGRPRAIRRADTLSSAGRVLVYRNHRLDDHYVVGRSHACVIEFWQRTGANLRAPAGARPGRVVPEEQAPAELAVGSRRYPTLSAFADHQALTVAPFPVDVVYTWVDDEDPQWREHLAQAQGQRDGHALHAQAANASRYRNRDELRYSLRSLAFYADFVRRVHIVTAGQVPAWLNVDHPDVRIVDHSEIIDRDCLPTFNSHAIESRLHHIDGLAEHYLYLNDDFLLGRQVTATRFFTPNGLMRVFADEQAPIPAGPPSPEDRPVDSAAKNVRDLMREHLDLRVGRKMLHVPYPQRRSVLAEMEERFAAEFARTASSRFRQPTDLNIASCFSHYYAFAKGRAVPGQIQSEYINVAFRWAPLQMRRLLEHRDRDAICLNETDVAPGQVDGVDGVLTRFLRSYLPQPSPFEAAPDHPQPPSRKNEIMSVNP
jgi:hypothetical protein